MQNSSMMSGTKRMPRAPWEVLDFTRVKLALVIEILVDELQFNIQGACTVASLSDFNTRGAKLRPGIYERVMQKPLRVALLLLN